MSTVFRTLHASGDGNIEQRDVVLEEVSDYVGISSRFSNTFPGFVREKKIQAVIQALQNELGPSITLTFPRLTTDVVNRLSDQALMEKPYLFLAVNNSRCANPQ
ncbi:MAG: hypothetical protein VKJ04_08690 [Vampirovibrionales bacterium]|nr:hypothetical protein [Vampirovibrionales bacterium]